MEKVARCPECKVPQPFNEGQMWLNNGDIVQSQNPQARVGFIECENLDPLFQNIGEIIGLSIEHLIVNIEARAAEAYMRKLIPQEIRDMVVAMQLDPTYISHSIVTLCHILGYGKYELLGSRYKRDEDDFVKYRITKPFSVPLAAGAMAGATSSVVEGEHSISYQKIAPETYEFTTSWTEYLREFKRRFAITPYQHADGDIDLERCSTCGIPKSLSNNKWYLEEGLIVNKESGRRMALLGPGSLDLLFRELEKELGETIPEVVVEAQRRFVKTGFYPVSMLRDEADLREQLALRGLGNLREIRMARKGLSMRMDNVIGYLLTVGIIQGLFETAYDVDSKVDWALSEDGDLEVQVSPKT
jgi:hypothetical protein